MDQNANVFITYVYEYKQSCQTIMRGYYTTGHTHTYIMNQILTMFLAIPYFQAPNASKKMKTTFPFILNKFSKGKTNPVLLSAACTEF